MNPYVKEFFKRGLIFGGGGPLVLGIVYLILSYTLEDFSLKGTDVFIGILSTYLLAFVHAGGSIFNQIEHWPISKSLLFHFLTLYLAYSICYLINAWIPFNPLMLLLFTVIFTATYFIVWITVVLVIKLTEKRLNRNLKRFIKN